MPVWRAPDTIPGAKVGCGIQTYFTPGMSVKGPVKVSDRAEEDRRSSLQQFCLTDKQRTSH